MSLFHRPRATPSQALTRRRFLAVAGMAATAVPILTACGSPGSGSSSGSFAQPDVQVPPGPFTGRTNVVVWSPWSGTNGEAFAALVGRFNESQSDVYVEVQQFQGYDGGVTEKLSAGLQARQIPEIAVFSDVSWNKFFLSNQVEPLDDYFTDSWNGGTYHDRLFEEGGIVRGGRRTGCRSAVRPRCSITTRRSSPTRSARSGAETWDEFRDWGKRITGRSYRATQ